MATIPHAAGLAIRTSNRTHVCIDCRWTTRRAFILSPTGRDISRPATCPRCRQVCVILDKKLRIPSPKDDRKWKRFWSHGLGAAYASARDGSRTTP